MEEHSEPFHGRALSGLDLGNYSPVWWWFGAGGVGGVAFQKFSESSAWCPKCWFVGKGGRGIRDEWETCMFT